MRDFVPRYIKISDDITKEIESGALKEGDRIYSEKDIMAKYKVSSTTARKALDVLRRDNIIESIQGKGSFVLRTKILRSLRKVISFTENVEKQSLVSSSKTIEKDILEGYTQYHKKLNVQEGAKILKLKRVKYGNNIPLLLDTRYINMKYFPGIENMDLDGSLYKLYESFNIKIIYSKQILKMKFLDEKNAKLLHLKKFDPVIYITGTLYSEEHASIEYEEDLWNGNVFSFYVESSI